MPAAVLCGRQPERSEKLDEPAEAGENRSLNEKGIAWMRRYPVFFWSSLDGKQRRYAILALGIFEQLEEESMDEFEKGKIRFAIFYREAGDFSGSVCAKSATGQSVQGNRKEMKAAVEGFCADGLRDVRHPLLMAQLREKNWKSATGSEWIYEAAEVHTGEPANKWYRREQPAKASGVEPVDGVRYRNPFCGR